MYYKNMVGGNGDSSIPFANARDILRAPKVVQNIDAERASTGENNPALNFPNTAKKPPNQSQTAVVSQVIKDDYKERSLKNPVNNPNDLRIKAKEASTVWESFNSNSPLLEDEDNPEAA